MNLLAFILIIHFAAGNTPVPTPTPTSISGDINADFLQPDALRGSAASVLEQRAAAVPEQADGEGAARGRELAVQDCGDSSSAFYPCTPSPTVSNYSEELPGPNRINSDHLQWWIGRARLDADDAVCTADGNASSPVVSCTSTSVESRVVVKLLIGQLARWVTWDIGHRF